ncbi:MAG TPA: 50S ribosomal L9 C-terminal domain-containing protein, partial [Candidatus Paceibacterota bacterium]
AQREKLAGLAEKLKGKTLAIAAKANDKGHLYKSVTPEMIAKEIETLYQIKVSAESITTRESIRAVGIYEVDLALPEQGASFKLEIAAA